MKIKMIIVFDKWKNTSNNDIEGEIWKPVPGFNQTEASNYGRIKCLDRWVKTHRSMRFIAAKIKAQRLGKDGYLRVDAALDGKCKKVTAHKMCTLAFKPNPLNKKTVQHFNDIKHCNEEWNLGWFTQSEQLKDTWDKNRRKYNSKENCRKGIDHYLCKLTDSAVIDIFKSKQSGRELAKRYGVDDSTISEIRHSKKRVNVTSQLILAK